MKRIIFVVSLLSLLTACGFGSGCDTCGGGGTSYTAVTCCDSTPW